MERIQPHIILGNLLKDNMPNDYTLYGYGNEYELKTKMNINNSDVVPLIWFELPYDDQIQLQSYLECDIRMFLATNTKKEWQNEQRYADTFTNVLNPLYTKLERLLNKSLSFQIVNRQITTNEMPNYFTKQIGTRDNPEKFKIEAYWDVLTLNFKAFVMANVCENEQIL